MKSFILAAAAVVLSMSSMTVSETAQAAPRTESATIADQFLRPGGFYTCIVQNRLGRQFRASATTLPEARAQAMSRCMSNPLGGGAGCTLLSCQ